MENLKRGRPLISDNRKSALRVYKRRLKKAFKPQWQPLAAVSRDEEGTSRKTRAEKEALWRATKLSIGQRHLPYIKHTGRFDSSLSQFHTRSPSLNSDFELDPELLSIPGIIEESPENLIEDLVEDLKTHSWRAEGLLRVSDEVREAVALRRSVDRVIGQKLSFFLDIARAEGVEGEIIVPFSVIREARLDKMLEEMMGFHQSPLMVSNTGRRDLMAATSIKHVWESRYQSRYQNIDAERLSKLYWSKHLQNIVYIKPSPVWIGPKPNPWQATAVVMVPNELPKPKDGEMATDDQAYEPPQFEIGRWWIDIAGAHRDGIVEHGLEKSSRGIVYRAAALPMLTGREELLRDGMIKYTRRSKSVQDVHVSLMNQTGRPVRVLRGVSLDSPFAPRGGVRYDGLWKIHSYSHKLDMATKLYCVQLTFDRCETKPSLKELMLIPNPSQMDDWLLFQELESIERQKVTTPSNDTDSAEVVRKNSKSTEITVIREEPPQLANIHVPRAANSSSALSTPSTLSPIETVLPRNDMTPKAQSRKSSAKSWQLPFRLDPTGIKSRAPSKDQINFPVAMKLRLPIKLQAKARVIQDRGAELVGEKLGDFSATASRGAKATDSHQGSPLKFLMEIPVDMELRLPFEVEEKLKQEHLVFQTTGQTEKETKITQGRMSLRLPSHNEPAVEEESLNAHAALRLQSLPLIQAPDSIEERLPRPKVHFKSQLPLDVQSRSRTRTLSQSAASSKTPAERVVAGVSSGLEKAQSSSFSGSQINLELPPQVEVKMRRAALKREAKHLCLDEPVTETGEQHENG